MWLAVASARLPHKLGKLFGLHSTQTHSPSVVPAANPQPIAPSQVWPARVKLLATTSVLAISTHMCRKSMGPEIALEGPDHSSWHCVQQSSISVLEGVSRVLAVQACQHMQCWRLLVLAAAARGLRQLRHQRLTWAFSACRRPMISVLLNSSGHPGPRPTHSWLSPLHVLVTWSQGRPVSMQKVPLVLGDVSAPAG